MHSLFDVDSPLMSILGKIFDCMVLSLCWAAASLPIVTMGAACGALYRAVYRCIRQDEGSALKTFWETFRKNIKMGLLVWLPILAVYVFLIADAVILKGLTMQGQPMARLYGIVLVLIAVASVWAAYSSAYCVRFNGSVKDVLWINFFLTLSHPLITIEMLLFLVLGFVLAMMAPFLLLFLPTVICLAISYPMERVFRKHMQPEDIEKLQKEHSL